MHKEKNNTIAIFNTYHRVDQTHICDTLELDDITKTGVWLDLTMLVQCDVDILGERRNPSMKLNSVMKKHMRTYLPYLQIVCNS